MEKFHRTSVHLNLKTLNIHRFQIQYWRHLLLPPPALEWGRHTHEDFLRTDEYISRVAMEVFALLRRAVLNCVIPRRGIDLIESIRCGTNQSQRVSGWTLPDWAYARIMYIKPSKNLLYWYASESEKMAFIWHCRLWIISLFQYVKFF